MDPDICFEEALNAALDRIGRENLRYNEDEFWMIERRYTYVENYAREQRMLNTCIALPLVRALHNGTYRKTRLRKNGVEWRVPYVIHCLMVCRMLVDLDLPLSHDEEDIVLASALCHDMIEDIPFPNGGTELTTVYGLDPRVYETVKRLSKRRDFTEEEHWAYFRAIAEDPLALLIKLSDRGNNVEDLYNMKAAKVREYIGETRDCFFPMVQYGLKNYIELRPEIGILMEKMTNLTETAEIYVDRFEKRAEELNGKLDRMREENAALKQILKEMENT